LLLGFSCGAEVEPRVVGLEMLPSLIITTIHLEILLRGIPAFAEKFCNILFHQQNCQFLYFLS